jgi:hypothetical protein
MQCNKCKKWFSSRTLVGHIKSCIDWTEPEPEENLNDAILAFAAGSYPTPAPPPIAPRPSKRQKRNQATPIEPEPMRGYPHECMHLLFENIIPMMIHLWKGNFRDVDTSNKPFVLEEKDWEEIGRLTAESNSTIPASFGRSIPNISRDQHLFTAEAYSFWFIHMAPALLLNRFKDQKYYKHLLLLIKIVKQLLKYEINEEEIQQLEKWIFKWVRRFEK